MSLELSIVVASLEAGRRIEASLVSLVEASKAVTSEIVVVDASADDSASKAAQYAGIKVHRLPVGALVPELWADGIRRTRGRVVAVTTAHTVVPRTWARVLVDALSDPDVGAVGGPLRLAPTASTVDAAVFFLRYAAFLPGEVPEGPVTGEIAGDNAAYRRADLVREPGMLANGFWEVPFHAHLRARGLRLEMRHAAWAEYGDALPFGVIARHRFHHGRDFGATRVEAGRSRIVALTAAPLVPAVLAWRAATRARRDAQHRSKLLNALPTLLALATAWAAGEAVGSLMPKAPHRAATVA